eukprot:630870-Rhodomonas_salina.4
MFERVPGYPGTGRCSLYSHWQPDDTKFKFPGKCSRINGLAVHAGTTPYHEVSSAYEDTAYIMVGIVIPTM